MKYILILALLSCSFTVNAVDLDIGIGYTQTEMPANGLWYQEEFSHSIDRESPSAHIGLRFNPYEKLYLIVGYKYMGEFSSDAMASSSDHNYYEFQKGNQEIWPLARWEGKGKAHGLYGTIEYNFKHLFVTVGGFYHVSTWKMDITNWRCAAVVNMTTGESNCPPAYPSAPYSSPQPLTVHADEDYQLGWTIGVGKKFGPVSVAYEMTDIMSKGIFPPTYSGTAQNISLTYTF